jgi:hypothetical protein
MLFFKARPLDFDPMLDSFFIPFHSPPFRLLGAPPERMEETTYMVNMIADAKQSVDELCDTRTGPQVRGESRRGALLRGKILGT